MFEEVPSLNHGRDVKRNKKKFNNLIPNLYFSLVQEDIQHPKQREAFTNNNCKTFCGYKTPVCVCGENVSGLDKKEECEKIEGCKWKDTEWRKCTPNCKKWKCKNCDETVHTSEIDQLEQIFNDTLKKYTAEYKSLGNPNLTKKEGKDIVKNIQELNTQLLRISEELYTKISNLEISQKKEKKQAKQKEDNVKKTTTNITKLKTKIKTALKQDKKELGEYGDNELRVNYAFTDYLVWIMLVAILISGLCLFALDIKTPFIPTVLLLIIIGYFLLIKIKVSLERVLKQYGG